jgi:rare lipoprotein A
MVLAAVVSLFAVNDSAPAEVQIEASAPTTSPPADLGDDELTSARVEQFAKVERPSRGAVITTTTTTEAPTTTTTAAPTTTTTAAPKPTTTTTAAPKPTTTTTAKATTTTAAPTTTTTAKPTTTSTMGPPPPCCREEGGASYHDYPDIRTCAHKSLPKGTALKVTNLANGKVTSCVVNDRGPYVEGRILDLSREAFAEIAAISDGVIRVSIEW